MSPSCFCFKPTITEFMGWALLVVSYELAYFCHVIIFLFFYLTPFLPPTILSGQLDLTRIFFSSLFEACDFVWTESSNNDSCLICCVLTLIYYPSPSLSLFFLSLRLSLFSFSLSLSLFSPSLSLFFLSLPLSLSLKGDLIITVKCEMFSEAIHPMFVFDIGVAYYC